METATLNKSPLFAPVLNGKIFVFLGKAAAGKTESAQEISRELGINLVVGATSRPARPGEIEGVHNYFLKKEDFTLDNFIEMKEFNGWMYGTPKNSIKDGKNYVIVLEPQGYRNMKAIYGDRVVGIYIMSPREDRFLRYTERDGNLEEANRRFKTDDEDFAEFEFESEYVIINNKEWSYLIYQLIEIIGKEIFG